MFLLDIAPITPEEDVFFSAAPVIFLVSAAVLALLAAAVVGVAIFLIIRALRKK